MLTQYSTTTKERKPIPIHGKPLFVGSRCIGEIVGKTLRKQIQPSGFLRIPPAIAWAVEAIRAAQAAGVERLEVICGGDIYRLTMEEFLRHAFPVHRGGWEPQLAAALHVWHIQRQGEPAQLALPI